MISRVTNSHIASLIYRHTNANLLSMTRLQEQVSSGWRVNSYADDPQGVGLIQRYDALLRENGQYARNIERARTMVQQTDTALLDLIDLLRDARELAQREVSGGASAETNRIGATAIAAIVQQVLGVVNQSVEGNSLFGGFRTDITSFVRVGGQIVYQGDLGVMGVQIGPHTNMPVNIPGSELIGTSTSTLHGIGNLAPVLTAATSLNDLAYGAGWAPGIVQWTGADGVQLQLDLSGAGTVGDVLSLLNAAGLNATLAADGSGLQVTDPAGGPLTFGDPAGGGTALSLGLVGSAANGVVTGTDVRTSPDWSVALADVPALSGQLPLGSLQVEVDGVTATVNLAGAATLGDVRTIFEAAVLAAGLPPLTMELNGAALNIAAASGAAFTISALPADGTAAALGVLGEGHPQRLFGVLDDLQAAMLASDLDGMRRGLGELEALEEHLLRLETSLGGRENMLDWMEGLNSAQDITLSRNRADIRDADLIQLSSDLKMAETTYQASLMVSSRLMQMSLFDFL
jgi:flagellar hook-associated protein 3 FlgL